MTTRSTSSLNLAFRLFLEEGPQAVWNRVQDRLEEKRRLRAISTLHENRGRLSIDFDPPPVLNVSPVPPSPRRGGAQIQMLDRLAEEKKLRTVALAYPRDGSWRLEIWTCSGSGILRLEGATNAADLIAKAAGLVRTSIVHLENLSGLPLHLVKDLEERRLSTVLSIHDFTLFCRRPHLIETATAEFCGYCRDLHRCEKCLQDLDPDPSSTQEDYRRAGAEALGKAAVAIYPSGFLQRQHGVLFPGHRGQTREIVIAPASSRSSLSDVRAHHRLRVGFVGGAYTHKGGALIVPTMERVRNRFPDAIGLVYGNGESQHFRLLRNCPGIRIRGYYRTGMLPSLLVRDQVSVTVLSSIWPEAYALVVDECLSAGVQVIAFDHGAVADRLTEWNVGDLVPLRKGANGLADSIVGCIALSPNIPDAVARELPLPESTAQQHVDLYRSLMSEAG